MSSNGSSGRSYPTWPKCSSRKPSAKSRSQSMIRKAIAKVVEREDLIEGEMIDVMNQIMSGECTPAQIGAFITALRMKGETVEEITGAARVMRERATPIRVGKGVLDIDRDDINMSLIPI